MKGGRWTKELELGLVKLYKKFRCLWMTSSPAYNDLDQRYAAYVRIVEALRPEFGSLTVPKVVYKIRDLRYRYCVELTKIERAAACGENYTPNVSWFQVIHSFLDLRFRTDENKDSRASAFSSEEKLSHDFRGELLTSSTCQTIYENNLKMEESKSTVGEFEESGNDAGNCADEVWDRRRRRREAEESEEVQEIGDQPGGFFEKNNHPREPKPLGIKMEEKMTKTLVFAGRKKNPESETEDIHEFDEFNAFAMSIGSQLKKLDPKLVAKVEMMILTILNEERTKSLR